MKVNSQLESQESGLQPITTKTKYLQRIEVSIFIRNH